MFRKKVNVKKKSKYIRRSYILITLLGYFEIIFPVIILLLIRLNFHIRYFPIFRSILPINMIFGLSYIILGYHLRFHRKRAFQLTITILFINLLVIAVKKTSYVEIIPDLFSIFYLITNHSKFYVKSPVFTLKKSVKSILAAVTVYYLYLYIGFDIFSRSIYPKSTILNIFLEPLRIIFSNPYYAYNSHKSILFEYSIVVIGVISFIYSIFIVLRPFIPQRNSHELYLKIKKIVMNYADDSLSYFSMQDNRHYFFYKKSFISYKIVGNSAIAGSNPIGKKENIPILIDLFISEMKANGLTPCFFGITSEYKQCFESKNFNVIKLGEEAQILLKNFDPELLKKRVRRTIRHAEKLGIKFKIYSAKSIPAEYLSQIKTSNKWQSSKKQSAHGFLMTLGRLPSLDRDKDCEFALGISKNSVLGYILITPVYKGNSKSLDYMKRAKDAPNGLMEFLIIKSALEFKTAGCNIFHLNFSVLAETKGEKYPLWVELIKYHLSRYISAYYQTESLYKFNSKFKPVWQSRYIAFEKKRNLPFLAIAILKIESLIYSEHIILKSILNLAKKGKVKLFSFSAQLFQFKVKE